VYYYIMCKLYVRWLVRLHSKEAFSRLLSTLLLYLAMPRSRQDAASVVTATVPFRENTYRVFHDFRAELWEVIS
jgi:hypothetical protein